MLEGRAKPVDVHGTDALPHCHPINTDLPTTDSRLIGQVHHCTNADSTGAHADAAVLTQRVKIAVIIGVMNNNISGNVSVYNSEIR